MGLSVRKSTVLLLTPPAPPEGTLGLPQALGPQNLAAKNSGLLLLKTL